MMRRCFCFALLLSLMLYISESCFSSAFQNFEIESRKNQHPSSSQLEYHMCIAKSFKFNALLVLSSIVCTSFKNFKKEKSSFTILCLFSAVFFCFFLSSSLKSISERLLQFQSCFFFFFSRSCQTAFFFLLIFKASLLFFLSMEN